MTFRERLLKEYPEYVNAEYGGTADNGEYKGGCNGCPADYGYESYDCHCDNCDFCWIREMPSQYKAKEETPVDNVNHPNHYNRPDSMECIDEMVTVFGKEAVKNFCLCNVWKYRYRAADKNGEEDLKKSDWYMKKYAELKGRC